MIQPPLLHTGDIIGIVALGKKLAPHILKASFKIVEGWGMHICVGENIYSEKHSYLSGTDEERINDFQQMLDDPSIKTIFCARGGYGMTRILDQLDFTAFLKNPKWICGFSDVTALHLKLQSLGVQSIHSTMPVYFTKPEASDSVNSLYKALIGRDPIFIDALLNNPFNKFGEAKGELVGGNLSLIVDSLGTKTEIQTENKILIIEEIDEYVYRLDRMMVQLKRAGKLENLAGLIVGHFTDIKETEVPFNESIESIILNHVKNYEYPIAFNFPIGHHDPNLAWVEGTSGILTVAQAKAHLSF
jgi:muramoyltetrapeptide carboxypeptidase